jgi:hydrogenase maturation factor
MEAGKLSPEKLNQLILSRLGIHRPETRLRASLGEDSAALDFGGDLAVVSTDPITGASREAGWLAVNVSCNDVATNGAEPVAVLLTLMAPVGTEENTLATLMEGAHQAAVDLNVEIVGGHTEIVPVVTQPIFSATAIGRVRPDRLLTTAGLKPGYQLIMTKGAGLEGTAILALDHADRLTGLSPEALRRAQAFAWEISIVRDALIAARNGATAMHDATEGGVLGAVYEMAAAGKCGVTVWEDQFPVAPETRVVCDAFGIDPLRLISSGALIICCPDGLRVIEALREEDIPAALIGEVTTGGRTIIGRDGTSRELTPPESDELWRAKARLAAGHIG